MIKHIVLYRLSSSATPEELQEAIAKFKSGIEALPATISVIRSIKVSANINPKEAAHVCLDSRFSSLDDLATYAAHPAHKAVAGAFHPFIEQRMCVDSEE